jgi:AcrR family transcriptional regulator
MLTFLSSGATRGRNKQYVNSLASIHMPGLSWLMPRHTGLTRRRILDSAYELFYRKGFSRVSVDEIAAFADITKRSLYYHFKSKDELLAAVFDLQHELAMIRIRKYEDRYCGEPEEILGVLFSELAKWTAKPGFAGAGFTRIVMELADLPGHPAHAAARRHKAAVEAWYAEILANAKVASPAVRAREVALLVEGAVTLILIHGNRGYAESAAQAAKQLVRQRD